MTNAMDTKFNIVLPVYTTNEEAFTKFYANTISFKIKKPKEAEDIIFYQPSPSMRDRGIHSYPHYNRLYIILQHQFRDRNELVSIIRKSIDEKLGGCTDCVEYDPDTLSIEELSPTTNESHFIIVRHLIYSLIYGLLKTLVTSRFVGLESSEREREGLTIYCDTLYSEDTYIEIKGGIVPATIDINRYLRLLFEVTPRGRGRIWFDIVTEAYLNTPIKELSKRLSHHEMKHRSRKLYNIYREKAQMKPSDRFREGAERAKQFIERIIGSLCYYVYLPDKDMFESKCVSFAPLHDVAKRMNP